MKEPLVGVSARNIKSELSLVAWVVLSIIEFDIVHKGMLSGVSRGRQANGLTTTQSWMNSGATSLQKAV